MKTKTLKAIAAVGLSALLAGNAAAQATESRSKPVGYETLTISEGFNYLGIRLHEAPVVSGDIDSADATSVTFDAGALGDLVADTTYFLEVDGQVVTFTTADVTGDSISTSDLGLNGDESFEIRPASTLESVFGSTAEAVALDQGQFGPGISDQIWVPREGGFDKYYFDQFGPAGAGASWARINPDSTNTAVSGSSINLLYTTGIVVVGVNGSDGTAPDNPVVVSGSVKTTPSSISLSGTFNYLSTISPAGATLDNTYGSTSETVALDEGQFGPGSGDQVWKPVSGGFEKYYFDEFGPAGAGASWALINADSTNTAVSGSSIMLDDSSGVIIVNVGDDQDVALSVPDFYSTL